MHFIVTYIWLILFPLNWWPSLRSICSNKLTLSGSLFSCCTFRFLHDYHISKKALLPRLLILEPNAIKIERFAGWSNLVQPWILLAQMWNKLLTNIMNTRPLPIIVIIEDYCEHIKILKDDGKDIYRENMHILSSSSSSLLSLALWLRNIRLCVGV